MAQLLLLGLLALPAGASVTQTVGYQGFLTDKTTKLPVDAGKDMQFALCDSADGACTCPPGSAEFCEDRCLGGNGRVSVMKGRYEIEVGSKTSGNIPASVFEANAALWLSVRVDPDNDCSGFEELLPRTRLQAAPYAFSAVMATSGTATFYADTIAARTTTSGGGVTVSTHLYVTSGNKLGVGTAVPSTSLHVSGGDLQVGGVTASTISASGYATLPGISAPTAAAGRVYYDSGGNQLMVSTGANAGAWVAVAPRGRYLGLTASTYNGNQGGFGGADGKCKTDYGAMARACRDIDLREIPFSVLGADSWIPQYSYYDSFDDGYDYNDCITNWFWDSDRYKCRVYSTLQFYLCQNWTSNSSQYAMVKTSGGAYDFALCSTSHYIPCCR